MVLSLCAMCIYQWNDQTRQRGLVNDLNAQLSQKLVSIQEYTNTIATMDGQIAQMDVRISELKSTVQTNQNLILEQKKELNRLESENTGLNHEVAEYKQGVDALQGKLRTAYESIQKQNQILKEVADERNDFVQRLNNTMKDRNDIVLKYNKLVADFQASQNAGKSEKSGASAK